MKKLFLTIQIIILISSLIFPQAEWEYLGFAGNEIFDIEIDDNGDIYTATASGPLYKSTDNGTTWQLKNNGILSSGGLKLDHHKNNIYLATPNGLYKTTNGGDNWNRIAQSITFDYFDEVRVIPNGYLFTSVFNMGMGRVFRSTDEGVTWEATNFTGFGARDMGVGTSGIMFFCDAALSYYAIYRSFDLGLTWEVLSPWMATRSLEYLRDGSVLAGVEGNAGGTLPPGIYKTTTNGDTWFNTNTFSGYNIFPDFVLDTNDDVYVTNGGVYLSEDSGSTWEYKGPSIMDVVECLAIDSSGYLYGGTSNDGIFRTPGRTTPVELVSFSAVVNENDVELSWITATELNNSGFEILRLTQNDNGSWERIGFVEGKGTTTESTVYNYTDKNLSSGSYNYRIKQIDYDGSYQYYNLNETIEISNELYFSLEQNYPNPFNPSTKISFQLPEESFITLKVFDAIGTEVETIAEGKYPAGVHEVVFNADKLSSGLYLYRIISGNVELTKKMMVVK